MTKLLDRAIVGGLLVAVAFTALALGAVEAWSIAVFELLVVALLLCWALKAVIERRFEIKLPSAAIPLGALILLGLAQSVAVTGSGGETLSLSMDVEATRAAVVVIFFLFVCFVIAANFFDTRQRLVGLANFLVIFGLALAVFALVQHFTWEGRLFWFRPTISTGAGTGGPFVNKNHFAGYMEMLIPIAVMLALSHRARLESRLFYGFAASIMAIAEAASLSRGGMVSLAAAALFIAAISTPLRDGSRARAKSFIFRPAAFMVVMLAAIIAGVVWVGADFDIIKRIASDPLTTGSAMDRKGIWVDTLAMFRAHPLLGVGLGAFETVYPIYGHGDGTVLIEFAHNDYLQMLADGGLAGAALAIWFLVVIARATVQAAKNADPLLKALGLGSAAGIFALLVHSLFDFNLQIPSNALLFLLLSAMVSRSGVTVGLNETARRLCPRVEKPATAAG